ncbi:MAG: arsC [Rhodospirillales bacterium]|nr:arsC [Rhodospirillales bacterium]
MNITIYHNPACKTSSSVLSAIREAGHEPRIVEYLVTPPTRDELASMIKRMGASVRDVARRDEAVYKELDLDAADDAHLLDAMIANPVLINRPIVVTDAACLLCRPAETVNALLG